MRLRDTQELFWRLITAPDGPGAAGVPEAEVAALFDGDARFTPVERADVYAEAYFWRIHDVLAEDFAQTRRALGEGFHALALDYLDAHPSEDPNLAFIGRRLPDFLRAHPLGRARPWLADLAALESARAEIFLARDGRPIDLHALWRIDPERFAALRLALVPALAVVRMSSRADLAWLALHDGAALEEPASEPVSVRVWRQEFVVYHRAMDGAEAEALDRAQAGRPLAVVCEPFGAADVAFQALGSWVRDGMVAGLLD